MQKIFFSTVFILSCLIAVHAQDQASSAWSTDVGSRYWVQPDMVYQGANNSLLELGVNDLIKGNNLKNYAVMWTDNQRTWTRRLSAN